MLSCLPKERFLLVGLAYATEHNLLEMGAFPC